MIDKAGKKIPLTSQEKKWCNSCRKNAEKIFSTMDHYHTPSKRETLSSIGVKFIVNFKTFLRSFLDLFSLFYCLALVKIASFVKYENGGQGSELS